MILSGCDFRVHVNQAAMFLQILLMPLVHVKIYPVFEALAKSGVDDVSQPLTRQQVELLFVRQVIHKLRVLLCFSKHVFHGQVFILRAEDVKVFVSFYS